MLGIQWFKGLRPIVWDFASLKIEFQYRGKKILIRGMRIENLEDDCGPPFLQKFRRAEEGLILQIWEKVSPEWDIELE